MGPGFLPEGGSTADISRRESKLERWLRAWARNWRSLEEKRQECGVRAGTAVKLGEGEEMGLWCDRGWKRRLKMACG